MGRCCDTIVHYLGPVLRWFYHPNQKIRVYELHNRLMYLHCIISLCYLAIAILRSVSNIWNMKHWNMKQQWFIFLMSNRECLNEAGGEPWYMCADRDSVDKKIPYLNFSIIAPWMLSISALVTARLHCHMAKHMAYEYYKQSGLVKTDRSPGSNSESKYTLKSGVTRDYLDSEHVFMNGIKILYWMEYSITAPLITAVVLYYSGVIEVRTHLICLASQATLMICGYALDALRHIKNKLDAPRQKVQKEDTEKSKVDPEWDQKFIPYAYHHIMAVGTINMLTVWLPPFVQLFTADRSPPVFVYSLVVIEFALFGLFGVAQAYYTYGWKWKCCCSCQAPNDDPRDDPPDDRTVSENETFAWLSAVSKVSLAIIFMCFL